MDFIYKEMKNIYVTDRVVFFFLFLFQKICYGIIQYY